MTTDKQHQIYKIDEALRQLEGVKRLLENDLPSKPTGYDVYVYTDKEQTDSYKIGPYSTETEAIVMLVRELDNRYPQKWELNGTNHVEGHVQFVHIDYGVLGSLHKRYDDWQKVGGSE